MKQACLLVVAIALLSGGVAAAQGIDCPPDALTTIMVEFDDNFQGPSPAYPSAALVQFFADMGLPLVGFDESTIDAAFAYTFTGLPAEICGAVVTMKLQAAFASAPDNDTVRFDLEDPTRYEPFAWRKVIRNIVGTWSYGQQAVLVLDLANLVPGVAGNTDILYALADGTLDVVVEDDTKVDYIKLELCTGCPVPVDTRTWGAVKVLYR